MSVPGLLAFVILAGTYLDLPPGTSTFLHSGAQTAVAAPDGGVWVGTTNGIVHFSSDGKGAVHSVPCCSGVEELAIGNDGTIWFATRSVIGRMTTAGTLFEQYPKSSVVDLAVASDGALWYIELMGKMGRIEGGIATEIALPTTHPWELAPAPGGEMWVLENGLETDPDRLFRVTPAGGVTAIALPDEILFGDLQVLADGSQHIGTRSSGVLRRLTTGAFESVAGVRGFSFASDPDGDLWSGGGTVLTYVSRSGSIRVSRRMPDPPSCATLGFQYSPVAVDAAGGVWVKIEPIAPPPNFHCAEPLPTMPDLIRVDQTQFVAESHVPEHVPTLAPLFLIALGTLLSLTAWSRIRG